MVLSPNCLSEVRKDSHAEAHYETFFVQLFFLKADEVAGDVRGSMALGEHSTAEVRMYDYGDGVRLAESRFRSDVSQDVSGSGDKGSLLGGNDANEWDIANVGHNLISGIVDEIGADLWIDKQGLGASDFAFGMSEFSCRCLHTLQDQNSQDPSHAAGAGGGGDGEDAGGVLALQANTEGGGGGGGGAGAAAMALPPPPGVGVTLDAGGHFPQHEITLSMWVKVSSGQGAAAVDNKVVLLSYVHLGDGAQYYQQLLLYLDEDIRLLIHGDVRHRSGYRTGITLDKDVWTHLTVVWRGYDGRVAAYKNGVNEFQDGPYKPNRTLRAGGVLAVGQLQRMACVDPLHAFSTCDFDPAARLIGQLQNVQIWDGALSQKDIIRSMHDPFELSFDGLAWFYRFSQQYLQVHI